MRCTLLFAVAKDRVAISLGLLLGATGPLRSPSNQGLSSRGCRLWFSAKYLPWASRSTWVSSGSRSLSGRTRTTVELAPALVSEIGLGAAPSRQCALVFSQKICADTLPCF